MILEKQPRAFVISIKDAEVSEKQTKECLDSADKYGWNVEVFWGVNGWLDGDRVMKENGLFLRDDHKNMRFGMRGCTLSHWMLWKRCVDIGEPIIIFEHDTLIVDKWRPIEYNNTLLKLHKDYRPNEIRIDRLVGRHTSSAHAYCVSPESANSMYNCLRNHGFIDSDTAIGKNIVKFGHLDSGMVKLNNIFSCTSFHPILYKTPRILKNMIRTGVVRKYNYYQ